MQAASHYPDSAPDGRVRLDACHLKRLRHDLGISQETLSESCMRSRLSLSLASIKRAESGKPVLYRTARHLAAFFGVPPRQLMQAGSASAPPMAAPGADALAYERSTLCLVLDTVKASGRGRLLLLEGPRGQLGELVAGGAEDARQRGFATLGLDQLPMDGAPTGPSTGPLLVSMDAADLGDVRCRGLAQRLPGAALAWLVYSDRAGSADATSRLPWATACTVLRMGGSV
jgi:transcriptional regulator with XRE-family HTH domain